MRRLLPLLGLLMVGCNFPLINLVPRTPASRMEFGAPVACQTLDGLEGCARYTSWSYAGLEFQVTLVNHGSKDVLVSPETFSLSVLQGDQEVFRRVSSRDPQVPFSPYSYHPRDLLQKHTLAPGESIRGTVLFLHTEHERRNLNLVLPFAGGSLTFPFHERPRP